MSQYVAHIDHHHQNFGSDGKQQTVSNPITITADSASEAGKIAESIAKSSETSSGVKTTVGGVRQLPEGRSVHWFPPGV